MNDEAAGAPHAVESHEPSGQPLRSDVQALIDAYRGLLAAPGDQAVTRVRRLRLALGLEHFLLERVRVGSETLQRRYALRASTGVAAEDEPERSRLRELIASLPPRPSRARFLLLAVAFLLAVRLQLAVIVEAVLASFRPVENFDPFYDDVSVPGDEIHAAIESLTRLDYTSVGRFFDVLVRESLLVSACVGASILAAAYLVLRPFAGGASLARALQDPKATAGRGRGGSLRQIAERLDVRTHERVAFARLGIAPPGEPRFDLVVRALLPLAVLVLSVAMWRAGLRGVLFSIFSSSDPATAGTIVRRPTTPLAAAFAGACLAAARLGHLAREAWARPSTSVLVAHTPEGPRPAARRSASRAAVAAAAGVGTAVVLAAVSLHVERAPSVGVGLSSPLTREIAGLLEMTVDVDVWCDRPCYLAGVNLVGAAEAGLVSHVTNDPLGAPSPTAFPLREWFDELAPRVRARLRFDEEQTEWLRERDGAWLRLTAGGGQPCYLGRCWGGTTVTIGLRGD